MIEYEQRDRVLLSLGFASYQEYLESKLWARIRERVFRGRKTCACCGEPANEVHHKDYGISTLSGGNPSALVPLCSTCHDIAEFDADGTKSRLCEANGKIIMLASLDKRSTPKAKKEFVVGRSSNLIHRNKRLSKRKLIRDGIPAELMPDATESKPTVKRSKRMWMPPVK